MLQHLPVWSISLSDYGGAAVISAPTDNHLVFRLHEFDENASVVRPSPVALPLGTASISPFHSLVYFSCVLLAQHRPSTSLSNKKPSLLFRVTNGHSLTIVIVATSLGKKKKDATTNREDVASVGQNQSSTIRRLFVSTASTAVHCLIFQHQQPSLSCLCREFFSVVPNKWG